MFKKGDLVKIADEGEVFVVVEPYSRIRPLDNKEYGICYCWYLPLDPQSSIWKYTNVPIGHDGENLMEADIPFELDEDPDYE